MKTYTKQQIFDFCDAYELSLESGLVSSEEKKYAKFYDKFVKSLYVLGTLVRKNNAQLWKKGCDSYHHWIGYKDDLFFLNTRREDDWSNGLVDQCLENFEINDVKEWVLFIRTEEYEENVKVISDYYSRTGAYFAHYIKRVRDDKYLDRHSYTRFVHNKYAEKVLTAYKAVPRFTVGSLADLRTNAQCTGDKDGVSNLYKRSPNGIMILSNTEPIVSACVGAKRYKAVCIGDTKPFWIEERYIKGRKKRK